MTDPGEDEQHPPKAGPLGSEAAEPDQDDGTTAGPVYPPEETEPDAHR
jgi:hypothetical protein